MNILIFCFLSGLDFAGRSLTVGFEQLSILGQIPINNDSFWEGYEHFSVSLSIQDRTYSKTIYIVDSNGKCIACIHIIGMHIHSCHVNV